MGRPSTAKQIHVSLIYLSMVFFFKDYQWRLDDDDDDDDDNDDDDDDNNNNNNLKLNLLISYCSMKQCVIRELFLENKIK